MAFAQHSKRGFPRLAAATLAVLLLAGIGPVEAHGLGVEADGAFGNLGFTRDRDDDDTDLGAKTYPWEGRLSVYGTVLDGFRLRGTYTRDPVARNTVAVTLGYQGQIVRVAAGPFVGFILDAENPYRIKPGVSASVRAELWKIGYASFESDITLDPQLEDKNDDFRQFRVNAQTGFYAENIITSLEFSRSTLFRADDDGPARDRRTDYSLQTELFRKNIPYRILLRFGYRTELKEFPTDTTHALGAAVFTPGVTYAPAEELTIRARLENGIYVFGREDLLGEVESDRYFFRALLGVRYSLPE